MFYIFEINFKFAVKLYQNIQQLDNLTDVIHKRSAFIFLVFLLDFAADNSINFFHAIILFYPRIISENIIILSSFFNAVVSLTSTKRDKITFL